MGEVCFCGSVVHQVNSCPNKVEQYLGVKSNGVFQLNICKVYREELISPNSLEMKGLISPQFPTARSK
jgi:hypothetical protein